MAGSSGGRGSQVTTQEIPAELKSLYGGTGQGILDLQRALPLSGGDGEFSSPRPAGVAPLSETQRLGLGQIPRITERPEGERLAFEDIFRLPALAGRTPSTERLKKLAAQRATGQNLQTSPIVDAAREFFTSEIEPTITNRAILSGLGRSTAHTNALARAQANLLLPIFQESLAGEERGIGREIAAEEAGIGLTDRALGREAGAVSEGVANLMTLGRTEDARRLSQIEAGMRGGDIERGVEQETLNAQFQDFLRRQALSEQALFGPMGQLPTTFGQTATTRQKGGGGMFKS